jgi:protocatechuate 3,4-dioxygenase beta subunit
MNRRHQLAPTRRAIAGGMLASPVVLALSGRLMSARAQRLEPTPACGDDPTPRLTEGPFFTPRSPRKVSFLNDGTSGEPILLQGYVLSTACRPVPSALVDLWHADASGAYDNQSYRFRGHQLTDDSGRYRFETILPGRYPGRVRHYHVKVQAPGQPVLTTQLYFPGEPGNQSDSLFREACLLVMRQQGVREGRFDFVLDLQS